MVSAVGEGEAYRVRVVAFATLPKRHNATLFLQYGDELPAISKKSDTIRSAPARHPKAIVAQ
jgi:hypothetical protein